MLLRNFNLVNNFENEDNINVVQFQRNEQHEPVEPLYKAAKDGDIERIRLMIEDGLSYYDLNRKEYGTGKTALHYASEFGHLDIVNLLLEKIDEPNETDNKGYTPLITASYFGHHTIVERLLEDENIRIDIEDEAGNTALIWASKHGNLDIVQKLIIHGANINHQNITKDTPLILASLNGHATVVEYLKEEYANLNLQNEYGDTALTTAFYLLDNRRDNRNLVEKYQKIIQTLVIPDEEGRHANLDLQNMIKVTALILAVQHKENDLVKLLLQNGADPNLQDDEGNTTLILAIESYGKANRNQDPVSMSDYFDIIQLLIRVPKEKKLNYDIANQYGKTALMIAVEQDDYNIAKLFLEHGAKITKPLQDLLNEGQVEDDMYSLLTGKPIPPKPMWKGWTRADIEHFHTVFLDQADANNNAVCPICLKYTLRQDGCMYMNHNCTLTPGFYHKELYQKYKDENGNINFCTICGRICSKGHSHYYLNQPNEDKPSLYPSGDYFENDCRISNHGGGLPEKLARFIGMRNKAIELNQQIDQITKQNALTQIVEAAWSAPLDNDVRRNARRQLEAKKFNQPNTNFPLPVNLEKNVPVNLTTLPNVTRPPSLREFVPVLHRFGENAISLNEFLAEDEKENYEPEEEDKLIEFRHPKLVNSTIQRNNKKEIVFHHPGQLISRDTLHSFVQAKLGQFKTDESAGMCPFYPKCPSRLYPEEIQRLVQEELYKDYRLQFNLKFREMDGGKKYGVDSDIDRTLPFFTEMIDGSCLLPARKKKGGKWKSRKQRKQQKKTYKKHKNTKQTKRKHLKQKSIKRH